MIIGVQNQSTRVPDEDVYLMAVACSLQLRHHVSAQWGIWPGGVIFLKKGQPVPGMPEGANIITVFDDSDQAGALGYHTEGPGGIVYGRVFAGPVLDNGGDALAGKLSVCSVLSHEVIETVLDPACNRWCDTGQGHSVALEGGDPVESDTYPVAVGTGPQALECTVSDFVTPAWFDPAAASGSQFDWMGLCNAPFELRPGGYVITMTDGQVSQEFGDKYPAWKKETKESELARTYRRLEQG